MTPGDVATYGTRRVRVLEIRDGVALVRAIGSDRTFRVWNGYLTPWRASCN